MKSWLTLTLICILTASSCAIDISRENSITISGKLVDISTGGKGGDFDLTFKLEANDTLYYINRGLEKFELQHLRESLIGKKIVLSYSKSILQPNFKHISEIKLGGKVFFTEYRD
jgi:hypothetical protein